MNKGELMADVENFDPASVTEQDILRFVEHFDLGKCNKCGFETFTMDAIEPGMSHPMFLLDQRKEYKEGGYIQGMACFSIICKRCGNVSMHLKEAVQWWLNNHE